MSETKPTPSSQQADKQTEFMVGALVGAVAGAAAALLLTPKTGQEMRKVVLDYAKELEGEAQQVAKEARIATKSLGQIINESASDFVEVAPQKIDQVSHQAQHVAMTLEQHLETARDAVSEIAEAFRSGWQEYGEEIVQQSKTHAPELPQVLATDTQTEPAPSQVAEDDLQDAVTSPAALQARRRSSHTHHYALHSTPEEQPHSSTPDSDIADRPYTTRVLEEVKPITPEEEAPAKAKDTKEAKESKPSKTRAKAAPEADDKPNKKLFFRKTK